MTTSEIKKILGVIKVAYPNSFNGMTMTDLNALITLWDRHFKGYSYETVAMALDSIISAESSPFMPTIGRIKEEIIKITQPKLLTPEEAWALVEKACKNGVYHAKDEWDKLPEYIKRLVTPTQIRDWAQMDADALRSVVASNWMRSFKARIKSELEYLAMPEHVQKFLKEATNRECKTLSKMLERGIPDESEELSFTD